MRTIQEPSGSFSTRFWHRFRLFDHRKALSSSARSPFAPARCFSTHFGRVGGCAQLRQNRGHTAAHLPRSHDFASVFPRAKLRLAERTGQHQVIHGRRHDQTPAFKLLGSANPSFGPEEILLEKAIGVLMREPVAIGRDDLTRWQGSRADPAKPTLDWITPGPSGMLAHDPVHAHLHLAGLAEMQLVPGCHLDRLARIVAPLPALVRFPPGLWLAPLKQGAMFARSSSRTWSSSRGNTIELAVALQTHERIDRKTLTGREKRSSRVPAIGQQPHPVRQEGPQVLQVRNSDLHRCLRTGHALLGEVAPQLLRRCGNSITVENCQPTLTGRLACGRFET